MTRIFQVDAFTDQPFKGNPAGVCVLDTPVDGSWMHAVAMEMNLSETAFLWPEDGDYRLRWFTPATEVDLCGHATLASSHVLWEQEYVARDAAIRFQTQSGVLGATQDDDLILLDFPAEPAETQIAAAGVETALGLEVQGVWRNRFDLLVELASDRKVRQFNPDFNAIARLECRGVIVTSRSDDPAYDFISRFFAPQVGVNEDPVTGSAHCFLGPFWGKRLGKERLTGYQASARGGVVYVTLQGERVRLGGHAITVLEGHLRG